MIEFEGGTTPITLDEVAGPRRAMPRMREMRNGPAGSSYNKAARLRATARFAAARCKRGGERSRPKRMRIRLRACGAFLLTATGLAAATAFGAAWETVPWSVAGDVAGKRPPPHVNAVTLLGRNRAYLGTADGRLLQWRGTPLLKAVDHPNPISPRTFVVNAADDVWVFGDDALSLHYDGNVWIRVDNPLSRRNPLQARLRGAGCAAPDHCFAGTRDGRLIEWDGREWREARSPVDRRPIQAMRFSSRQAGWMVGDGFFARWDGTAWTKADMEDVPRMYDLVLPGSDRGWAVGDHGALFAYDGAAWARVEVPASIFRLRAIDCASRLECWAVGEAGAALRWNGTRWQRKRLGTPNRLTTVSLERGTGGTGLLAGRRGTLFRRVAPAPAAGRPAETP